jgi:AcrR family transcriptional regulator
VHTPQTTRLDRDRSAIVPDGDEPRYVLPPLPAEARHEILDAIADLLRHHGVNGFSTADVLDAVGVDLDQVGESITSSLGLVQILVLERVKEVLDQQEALLRDLGSLEDLHRWRDEMVRAQASDIRAGCPLGTLVGWIADHHEGARAALRAGFDTWERYLAAGIERMAVDGEVWASDVDAKAFATSILAALQGGILLARTSRQLKPLECALDMAIAQVSARSSARPPV